MSAAGGDLLGLIGEPVDRVRRLLDLAQRYEPIANDPSANTGELAGRMVGLLFFEDSTRTRMSFEAAAVRLGASVMIAGGSGTSISKGETIEDTARTVESLGMSALVIRGTPVGIAHMVARVVGCPVINAGDGAHEHPTQALLDAYAVAEAHGRLGHAGGGWWDLSGLTVAIVGDVAHSRVARSNLACLTMLGAKVVCVGPPGLAPAGLCGLGEPGLVEVSRDLDDVLERADAVMMLRMQFERHGGAGEGSVLGSRRQYRELFALTRERAGRMKDGAIVMHPGPMNRGLEIDGAVADGERSVILRQVALGVAVRMGALVECLGEGGDARNGRAGA
ncbi:MAG: aspartate carbamoyltransferase catalytic subunit [Phycisphaerales bacterium JB037]